MSNGSKIIKIAFVAKMTSHWIGGINYFKNLFIAMSKTDNPKIVPYILPPEDKEAEILLKYAKVLTIPDEDKFSDRKKFWQNFYENINVDLISHTYFMTQKSDIAWIADFQHIHLPEMFSKEEIKQRNSLFQFLAENNRLVILSSYDALNDFKIFSPQNAHKGRVLNFVAIPDEDIYNKTDEMKNKITAKFNLPEKYFYVPNQFWKHKNHKVIFDAISLLKEQGVDIKIVFSGNTNDYRHKNFLMN